MHDAEVTGAHACAMPADHHKRSRLWPVLLICAAAGAIAAIWHFTPLAVMARPDRVAAWLDAVAGSPWSPAIVVSIFVVGGFVLFPVTILSAATALVFHPLIAAPISFTGEMLSAALMYGLGARFIGARAREAFGSTIQRIDQALVERGVLAIAAIRTIPLAPFTVINVAAGTLRVRFRDYMLGTAMGLAPGVILTSVFGRQVRSFWRAPTREGILILIGVGLVWIGVSVGLQRWLARKTKVSRG